MAALVTMPGATGQTTSSEDASAAGLTMVHPASDDGQSSCSPGANNPKTIQQPTEGISKAPRRKRRQRHLEDSSQGSSSSSSSGEEEEESSVLMMRRTMAAAAAILTNPPVEVRSHPSDEVSSGPAPSDGQLFSLRWHDFQSSILSSFRHLRDSEDFVDVTLACDGGRYFTAHKMVLSACSPYFRHLLKANPCQHPIVILRDVKHRDMETLLRFMYNGEVSVSNEQLPSVLATARTLQVKGLADVIPNSSADEKHHHPPPSGITAVDNNKPNNNNNLGGEQQQQLHIHHNNNNNNKRVMDYAAGNEAAGSSSRESSTERSSRKRAREDVVPHQAAVIPPLIRNGLAEDEEDEEEEEDEMEDEDLMDSEEERMRLLEAHRESLLSQALEGRSSQSLMAHLMATRRTSGNQSEASSVGGNNGPNNNTRAMMQHLHHSSGGHHPNDDDASDTDDTDASDRDRTDVGDLSNMDDNVYPSSGLMGDLHHHGQHPLHRSSSGQHFGGGGDGMHPPSSGGSYGGSGSHHPLLNLQGLHSLFPGGGGSNGPSGRDGGHNSSNSDLANATRRSLDLMRIRATDPRPCPQCGKIYRSAHTLRTHLEDKHTVCPGYRCVLCGTVAKSRNSLHSHMSRQHRGISTKDLPVVPMPAPFDPVLASCLLAKAGVKVSPAELAARASPTSGNPRGRTADLRLDFKSPHSSGGSLTPGSLPPQMMYNINQKVTIGGLQSHRNNPLQLIPLDAQDAEDLSLAQQRLRDQSSSGHHRDHHHHHQHHHHRRENKGEERGGERSSMATISPYGPAGSDRGGSGSAAAGLVNRLGLSGKAGKQWLESNMAAAAAIQQQQQQAGSPGGNNPSGNAAGTGSALLDTYLQLIAEHSSNMAAAAAAAAAAAQQQQSGRGGGHNDDDSPLMDSPKAHQLTGE